MLATRRKKILWASAFTGLCVFMFFGNMVGSAPGGVVKLFPRTIQLGSVRKGTIRSVGAVLVNASPRTVKVQQDATCDCIESNLGQIELPPYGITNFRVDINTAAMRPGPGDQLLYFKVNGGSVNDFYLRASYLIR